MMSSPTIHFLDFTLSNALHLALIVALGLVCVRLIRTVSSRLVRPASGQTKGAQLREQQTQAFAKLVNSAGSSLVWVIAVLTALPEFGISALPGVVIAGATILGLGIVGRDTIRDLIAGVQLATEDQFAIGDTIQAGGVTGRVEQWSLRRTVVRDGQGALVSRSNSELRTVGNLSRDWSQAYVDIGVAADAPIEKVLQALEGAAAELRSDGAWSQALVDGPRVLGLQEYEATASTVRLQVRTAPTRQEEVCRELRRRIQMAFQRQGIVAAGRETGATPGVPLT
jgi:small-conductance mechanosensitive channel